MVLDAPREQWLIDLRAEIDALFPAEFVQIKDQKIRNWAAAIGRGQLEAEDLIQDLQDDMEDYYDISPR